MTNTVCPCQKWGGLKSKLFSTMNFHWKITVFQQHERKEIVTKTFGYSKLNKEGGQAPRNRRPDHVEAKREMKRVRDEHVKETSKGILPIHPAQSPRQQRGEKFEGLEEHNYRVDPQTGWGFCPTGPQRNLARRTPSSSATNWKDQDTWTARNWDWQTSRWSDNLGRSFRFPGGTSRKPTGCVQRSTSRTPCLIAYSSSESLRTSCSHALYHASHDALLKRKELSASRTYHSIFMTWVIRWCTLPRLNSHNPFPPLHWNSTSNTARTELHSMITFHHANTRGSRAARLRIAHFCDHEAIVLHESCLVLCRTWHWPPAQVFSHPFHLLHLSFRHSHQHPQDLRYTMTVYPAMIHDRVADQHKYHLSQVMSPKSSTSSLKTTSPEELSLTGIFGQIRIKDRKDLWETLLQKIWTNLEKLVQRCRTSSHRCIPIMTQRRALQTRILKMENNEKCWLHQYICKLERTVNHLEHQMIQERGVCAKRTQSDRRESFDVKFVSGSRVQGWNLLHCFHQDAKNGWNLIKSSIFKHADPSLSGARSEEIMEQELQVESLNKCISELQQQTYAERLELQDAQHGYIESRREQSRPEEESIISEGTKLRDTQIRNFHEMGEMKRTQELRVDEFSVEKLRECHETIQKLNSQTQEMQEQMNSVKNSGEFQEVESILNVRLPYFSSKPAAIPSSRSVLSRDKRLPLDTWNTSGPQEFFFGVINVFLFDSLRNHSQGVHHSTAERCYRIDSSACW